LEVRSALEGSVFDPEAAEGEFDFCLLMPADARSSQLDAHALFELAQSQVRLRQYDRALGAAEK
jgi:hypothetical protein